MVIEGYGHHGRAYRWRRGQHNAAATTGAVRIPERTRNARRPAPGSPADSLRVSRQSPGIFGSRVDWSTNEYNEATNDNKRGDAMTEFLKLSDAAKALGVHTRTMHRWIASGRLDARKTPGGHWRVSEDAIAGMEISLREFARMVGVHHLTARRWCEAGKIEFRRTAGGRYAVPLSEVERIGAGKKSP